MPQYFKLRKKAEAGARFVINQIGWNTRKDDELLRWIRREGLPLVGARERLSPLAAGGARLPSRARSRESSSPTSCSRSPSATARARTRAGRSSSTSQPKHVAVARGLGFDGVYLGGHMPASTFGEILDHADAFASDDWRAVRAGDPLSVRRTSSTSSSPTRRRSSRRTTVNAAYLDSKRTAEDRAARAGQVPLQPARSTPPHSSRTRRSFRPGARSTGRSRSPAGSARPPRARAGGQGAALRLPRLRRLLAARHRLRLPGVAVREEPAQRAVRRHPRGLCEVYDTECIWSQAYERLEGVRRGGVDARRPGDRARTTRWRGRARGEHLPRPRPPRAGATVVKSIRLPDIVAPSSSGSESM